MNARGGTRVPLRSLRVLIVEDNPTDRAFVRLILASVPDVVPTIDDVESGREAQRLIRENQYDLVIADNHLVGPITGIDVLRLARELQPKCRRVFITGDTRPHVLDDARRIADPTALLPKSGRIAANIAPLIIG